MRVFLRRLGIFIAFICIATLYIALFIPRCSWALAKLLPLIASRYGIAVSFDYGRIDPLGSMSFSNLQIHFDTTTITAQRFNISYSPWQLIENKQKFIGQIMTSKSPVRSCEDVDEAALSYASSVFRSGGKVGLARGPRKSRETASSSEG